MTTATAVDTYTFEYTCTNRYASWHGAYLGEFSMDVPRETLTMKQRIYCGRCREYHTYTLRIG